MNLATLNDVFFTAVERNLDRAMLHRQEGKWLPVSSAELRRNVSGAVGGLQEWGVHQGDRIAILSENRPEWSIADFAILLLGAVTVPVYATLTPKQTAFTLRDSGTTVLFVSTGHQLRKVQTILPQIQVQKIVVMDHLEIPSELAANCVLMDRLMTQGPPILDPATEA
ncbi:MAG TPA: AMP-binding protein, partial [Candidatus Deferrimicrobiaceae bacterium]|nr:AMP-binding protein [Candidatus Deferrimicrobiaceae bacterium]